ncbi:hypothetical protein GCM10027052_27600 [Parafrigoribacterium mesophilum]|uniref:HNH endonuclease signature motif containing protein n=1 Tax=Parafrigoribacterium mesophilum TaxID=433646 RepID=UPI0031FE3719
MEQLFDITVDEATMLALCIPVLDGDFPVDRNAAYIPVDPQADVWELAWHAVQAAELAAPSPQRSIRTRIDNLVALRQRMSALQVEEMRELAAIAKLNREQAEQRHPDDDPDWGNSLETAQRSLAAELALANKVSARTMENRLGEAEMLVDLFPTTLETLATGEIGLGHARVIMEHGAPLDDDNQRAKYEHIVLERAVNVTPGRLTRKAELTATRLRGGTFDERHDAAADGRSLLGKRLKDGMSLMTFYLPTVLAEAIRDRLTRQAKAIRNAGDPRTLDQIRCDLAAELLLTGEPAANKDSPHGAAIGITAEVCIVIPALTLLGKSDDPATLNGGSPIGLEDAKALAADAPVLVRILTDPVSDQVLAVDTYRPSKKLRRFLRLRDGRCRFPICNAPAHRADIDHTIPAAAGGPTEDGNLEYLCRGDHILKHHGGWSVRQISPGVLEWTSPHGIVAIDEPDPPVAFGGEFSP